MVTIIKHLTSYAEPARRKISKKKQTAK